MSPEWSWVAIWTAIFISRKLIFAFQMFHSLHRFKPLWRCCTSRQYMQQEVQTFTNKSNKGSSHESVFFNHYYNFAWSFVVVFIFINEKTCFKTHWLHCSVGYDGAKREKHLSLSYPTQTSLGFQNEQLVEAVESKAICETQESRRLLGCSVLGGGV